MTNKRGTVKLFTFSFETDDPNLTSSAPKIFSSAPKNLHLVAQVLPNSNLNFEPCLTVRDLDEIVSLGKSRNLKLINLKSHAPFIIKLHSENLLEVFSPFIHHKYTEMTYLSFEKRRTRPNSQGSFLLSSLYLFSNCISILSVLSPY